MATREQNIQTIRTAVYGKDVREAIADAMEQTYDACEDFADSAEDSAEAAATSAEETIAAVEAIADRLTVVYVSGTTLVINTGLTDVNEVEF